MVAFVCDPRREDRDLRLRDVCASDLRSALEDGLTGTDVKHIIVRRDQME